MFHRVQKRKYTTPQAVQEPTEVDGERYKAVAGGFSW